MIANFDLTDENIPDDYRNRVKFRSTELGWFKGEGVLPPEFYDGKTVLDWECGDCAYSIALLAAGASSVTPIDTWYSDTWIPEGVRNAVGSMGKKISIKDFISSGKYDNSFDLVFSNTVTEHIQDMPDALSDIYKCIRPGGYFFTNHGNYYDPVGHHDHGFLFYRNGGVEFLGPKCWETEEKCATSAEFRKELFTKFKWTMQSNFEEKLTPDDCSKCPFFKRATPWAHLIYQREFRDLWGSPGFTMGRRGSSINKLTSFQVRQLLIEAGFDLISEHRTSVYNEPPEELLGAPHYHSIRELKTGAHRYLARKPT